ncbi:MAG TPA: hypothetical protein VMZ91_14440 [Candidatus Paceibacterota bacterium]|nr:hypothetical protein [Candidatus Paceibacterota bacterium]
MSDFIDSKFRLPNIPQQSFPQKIKLLKNNVTLQFLASSDTGKFYQISFLLNITPSTLEKNPSIPINPSTVDMEFLKKAILDNILLKDKRYLILKNYDTRKVIFNFNHELWLKEAVREESSVSKYTRFAKDFRLKVKVPLVVMMDPMRNFFGDFIIRKFIEYMESKRVESKWFKHLLPDEIRKRARYRVRGMFDWNYDFTWNVITATLKPLYAMALIYATGMMIKKIKMNDLRNANNQQLFVAKVKDNVSKFNYGKFDKYSKKRGFI